LEDLSAKENRIIFEILVNKNWLSIITNDAKKITSFNWELEDNYETLYKDKSIKKDEETNFV
jgi:hypothetical protein